MSAVQTLGFSTPCWAFPATSAPPASPSLSLDQPRNQTPGLTPTTPSCLCLPTLSHHLPRFWPAGCSWSLLQWPAAPPSLPPIPSSSRWPCSPSRGPAGIPVPRHHPPPHPLQSSKADGCCWAPQATSVLSCCACPPAHPSVIICFRTWSPSPGPMKRVLMTQGGEKRKQLRGL